MPNKLDILRLFLDEESLTPFALANLLDIKQNYARQIILRLKRQGLIFLHQTFIGGQAYSLTSKGEARVTYLAGKQVAGRKREEVEERGEREEIEEREKRKAVKQESGPRPRHLSLDEMVLLNALTKPEKGKFLVTKEGDIFYDEKEGYLSPKAAVFLAAHRKIR